MLADSKRSLKENNFPNYAGILLVLLALPVLERALLHLK